MNSEDLHKELFHLKDLVKIQNPFIVFDGLINILNKKITEKELSFWNEEFETKVNDSIFIFKDHLKKFKELKENIYSKKIREIYRLKFEEINEEKAYSLLGSSMFDSSDIIETNFNFQKYLDLSKWAIYQTFKDEENKVFFVLLLEKKTIIKVKEPSQYYKLDLSNEYFNN